MIAKLLAVVCCLTLFGAAPARADVDNVGNDVPGFVWRALAAADDYWVSQGEHLPCGGAVSLLAYTSTDDEDLRIAARGEQSSPGIDGCTVWVTRKFIRNVSHAVLTDHIRKPNPFLLMCGVLVHERGHNVGRGHADGVMSVAGMTTEQVAALVPQCVRYAAHETALEFTHVRTGRPSPGPHLSRERAAVYTQRHVLATCAGRGGHCEFGWYICSSRTPPSIDCEYEVTGLPLDTRCSEHLRIRIRGAQIVSKTISRTCAFYDLAQGRWNIDDEIGAV